MAVKESQIRYNPGEGHPDCTHPNIEYSELSKGAEERRRYQHGIDTKRAEVDALKKWHAGKHFEVLGDNAAAVDCFNKSQGSKANADGKGFEQKVADATNAKWTSVEFHCPKCGLSGDIDVVTDKGVAKECKISADAASEGQFNKISSAVSAIFGAGTAVHIAVPSGQAAAVRRKFAQDMKGKVQSH